MNFRHSSSSNIIYQSKLRQYNVIRNLGQGGFATCYQVIRIHDQKRLAMKIIPLGNQKEREKEKNKSNKDHKNNRNKLSTIQKAKSETKILSRLNHPNIVRYQTQFIEGNQFHIVMELCQNGSLNDLLKRRRFLTQVEARYYIQQIVHALIYLKSMNIVHRDLKPANFFIDSKMKLKIGDFGLAANVDYNFHKHQNMCGTPNYISPQMLTKSDYSYQVDVWSIGVILYTMLYGIAPFQTKNKTAQQTYDKIKKCQYTLASPSVSKQAKDLISKILVLRPKQRITLNQILLHPFLNNYTIPCMLHVIFCKEEPDYKYIEIYQKQIKPTIFSKSNNKQVQSQTIQNKQFIFKQKQKQRTHSKSIINDIDQRFLFKLKNIESHENKFINFQKNQYKKQINQVATASPKSIENSNRMNNNFSPESKQQKITQQMKIKNKNIKNIKIHKQEKMDLQESYSLKNQKTQIKFIYQHLIKEELSFDIIESELFLDKNIRKNNKIIENKQFQVSNLYKQDYYSPKIKNESYQKIIIQNILKHTVEKSPMKIAYLLSSSHIGILFNDNQTILIDPKKEFIYFINNNKNKNYLFLNKFNQKNQQKNGQISQNIFKIHFNFLNDSQLLNFQSITNAKNEKIDNKAIITKQNNQYLTSENFEKLIYAKQVYKHFSTPNLNSPQTQSSSQSNRNSNNRVSDQEQNYQFLKYFIHFKQTKNHYYFQRNDGVIYNFNVNYIVNQYFSRKSNIKNSIQNNNNKKKNVCFMTQTIYYPQINKLQYYQVKNQDVNSENKQYNERIIQQSQKNIQIHHKFQKLCLQLYPKNYKKPLLVLKFPLETIPQQKIKISLLNSFKFKNQKQNQFSKLNSQQLSNFRNDLLWFGILKIQDQNNLFIQRIKNNLEYQFLDKKQKNKTNLNFTNIQSDKISKKTCKNLKIQQKIQIKSKQIIRKMFGLYL